MNTQEMVEAAAKWMDDRKPGWERQLDLGTFDIGHAEVCIVGQTFGQHMFEIVNQEVPIAFRKVFCTVDGLLPEDWYGDFGNDDAWVSVERFWVDEIKARLNR